VRAQSGLCGVIASFRDPRPKGWAGRKAGLQDVRVKLLLPHVQGLVLVPKLERELDSSSYAGSILLLGEENRPAMGQLAE